MAVYTGLGYWLIWGLKRMPQILYISNLIFHSVVLPRPANFGYTSILFKRSNEESFLPICMLISCASFALLLCLSAALSANESKSNFLWTMCELPFRPFTNLTYVAGLALLTEPLTLDSITELYLVKWGDQYTYTFLCFWGLALITYCLHCYLTFQVCMFWICQSWL